MHRPCSRWENNGPERERGRKRKRKYRIERKGRKKEKRESVIMQWTGLADQCFSLLFLFLPARWRGGVHGLCPWGAGPGRGGAGGGRPGQRSEKAHAHRSVGGGEQEGGWASEGVC